MVNRRRGEVRAQSIGQKAAIFASAAATATGATKLVANRKAIGEVGGINLSDDERSSAATDETESVSGDSLSRRSVLKLGALGASGVAASRLGMRRSRASSDITINMFGTIGLYYYKYDFAAYEKTHPGIKFVYHSFPFDSFDTVISSHMETHDDSYSFYEVDEPRVPQFATKGWLTPITSPSQPELAKLLLGEQLTEVTYNNKVVALPESTSTQFLYYNKDLLAKAHITPPPLNVNARWTWPQLYEAALAVKNATGKAGLLFEQVNRIYQLQPLPQGLGGGPGVSGPQGLTPNVDNAAWIAAMEWYQKCFTSGVTPKSVSAEETEPTFAAGDAAFFWGGPWDYYTFVGQKGLSFGVAPQPHWAGHPAMTPTDSWALGLNPYGPYQPEALDFIEYLLLSTPGSLIQLHHSSTGGGPGNPPANLASLEEYYKLWPAAIGDLIKYELSNTAIHRARSLGWVQFETAIEDAFASISDGSSVKAALANAQSTLKDSFSQIAATL
jgi:multiple sugar transport system substrate-binding protein